MALNNVGNIINIWWQKTFETYQNIIIDEYVIMPNHIIIQIVGAGFSLPDNVMDNKNHNNDVNKINGRENRAPTKI